MKMHRLVCFIAVLLAGADFQQPDLTLVPEGSLEGTWDNLAIKERGSKTSWTSFQWTFKDGKVAMSKFGKANFTGTFLTQQNHNPPRIDINYTGGTICGIYEIKGAELRICCKYNSKDRPDRVDGGKYTVLIFQRALPR